MGFLNRAANGVFSLTVVTALLVGGHWITRSAKRTKPAARVQKVADVATFPGPIPDCKMPESPPASGPLNISRATQTCEAGVDQLERPILSPEVHSQAVIHAISGHEPATGGTPSVADAHEMSPPSFPQPHPMPARTNAIPLRPEGPEFPSIGEPPASAPAYPGASPPAHGTIDRALPNSTAEEREIWHDALKDLSPKDVRETWRLRQELGRIPPSLIDGRSLPAQPLWPQAVPGPMASEPLAPPDAPALLLDAQRETSRTIASTLDALAAAQQVLLNNIANANTDGYKRLAIAFEGVASFSNSRHGSIGAGVRLGRLVVELTQGRMRHTDRPLDLAIEGEGFFQLEDVHTHQTFYTRCGRFSVNAKGEMVWRAASRELQLRPAVVTGPENQIEIAADGTVGAAPAGSAPNRLPQIRVVRLPAMVDLVPTGENLFTIRDDPKSGQAPILDPLRGRLRQGSLEESNVDVDRELHELDGLHRHARVLEMAAHGLSFSPRELVSPHDEATIPSHFAGSLAVRH
ncbi:MAG TPA: flagellar hook-basal body complex protein [Planctomycetaceae bacterium]|nr:flagellar hook-basal body complex protein [Planctomycetaceae bacterium]